MGKDFVMLISGFSEEKMLHGFSERPKDRYQWCMFIERCEKEKDHFSLVGIFDAFQDLQLCSFVDNNEREFMEGYRLYYEHQLTEHNTKPKPARTVQQYT